MQESNGEGGFSPHIAKIEEAERILEMQNSSDAEQYFEELCKKYEIFYSETGELENFKIYNYNDLITKITLTERQFNDQKQVLLDLRQKFIYEFILLIDAEGEKSK